MTTPVNTSKPTAAATTPARRENGLRMALIGGAVALTVVVVAAVLFFTLRGSGVEPPRLNADTVTLVKFVVTPEYAKLPFDRQSLYMKVLEDRQDNDELDKAYSAGKITESELRAAKLESWLGQQLKRSEKYANLPAGARPGYIAELLDRKQQKDAREAKMAATGGGSGSGAVKPVSTGSDDRTDVDDVKRDETMEKVRLQQWPADVRMQWETFDKAYDEQRAAREAAQKAAEEGKQTAATQE